MIIELAHFFAILALGLCLIQFIIGGLVSYFPKALGSLSENSKQVIEPTHFKKSIQWMSYLQFIFLFISFLLLATSFLTDDFSVALVANHSSINLPDFYKFAALWGNHEGSILLWGFVLSFYSALVALFSKSIPDDYQVSILAILGLINLWLLSYMLFLSSPFTRLIPPALLGSDLNPLLQDLALIFHPPILYFGYVGLAVPFASALTGLLKKDLSATYLLWMRPFVLFAWVCLTAGVSLGSFWAYYELGWGGFWFWDPVENSSLMPWLIATALIHSLVVSQKRASQKNWTVILALLGFNLSLLGTFLVRSGVITSVHSFASDPNKGLFILIYLVFFSAGSVLVYLSCFHQIKSFNRYLSLLSRETMMLVGNIFFIAAFIAVFLGTLYPLFLEALNLPMISIGKPYYNQVFVPLMVPVLFMLALAPWQSWNESSIHSLNEPRIRNSFILAILVAIYSYIQQSNLSLALAFFLFVFVFLLMIYRFIQPSLLYFQTTKKISLKIKSFASLSMQMAHIGVAVFALGATFTTQFGAQVEKLLKVDESYTFKGYEISLAEVNYAFGPNYTTHQAKIDILVNSQPLATIYPEKREYQTGQRTSESAIFSRFSKDITISFAEVNESGYAFRIYYQPYIRLIWLGVILMVMAGILGLLDKRFRTGNAAD